MDIFFSASLYRPREKRAKSARRPVEYPHWPLYAKVHSVVWESAETLL